MRHNTESPNYQKRPKPGQNHAKAGLRGQDFSHLFEYLSIEDVRELAHEHSITETQVRNRILGVNRTKYGFMSSVLEKVKRNMAVLEECEKLKSA